MDLEFRNESLEIVYYDPLSTIGHGHIVDKGFRKVVNKIVSAEDEQDLRALKGLHYHKLSGNRSYQWALNINDQWRLIIEPVEEEGHTKLLIISVEDYH